MAEKEYIEREAAKKVLADDYAYAAAKLLDTVPTADVQEVRHGKWERALNQKHSAKWSTRVACSICHKQGCYKYNFCPNCGAKMDKE